MDLEKYFADHQGIGVLATADDQGKVNAAIYSRPHFLAPDTVAFIMPDRLTHHNLQSNFQAHYLFLEQDSKSKGRRLYLTKLREEQDSELLHSLRRHQRGDDDTPRFLVTFKIDKVLPLVGAGPLPE
ncbi:MAG: pyridoxamine 5'-phosphate oxidase family protein [Desulfarculaceae bacterium]|jgi:hypothetical protein